MAIEAMLTAWQGGDFDALPALLADDARWTIAGSSVLAGTVESKPRILAQILGPFGGRFARSPDRFRPRTIHGIYADGDSVVAWFDGAGITNDGWTYRNSYAWIMAMRNGRLIRVTAFFDGKALDDLWERVRP